MLNHRTFFTPDNKVQYLSGQPLYVITLTLTDVFRQAVGPHVPISFSAGIDQANFPHAVACGFVPVTVSSDLLRPGGYGRISTYLQALDAVDVEGRREKCQRLHSERLRPGRRGQTKSCRRSNDKSHDSAVRWAGCSTPPSPPKKPATMFATAPTRIAKLPRRIDSHLVTFDCITCDKCLPVCPNAANFTYPTPLVAFDYHDLIVDPDGTVPRRRLRHFEITEKMQIACYSDFCNECGNCDTFCPEYGGPYIKKPTFYGSEKTWTAAAPRDGFFIERTDKIARIRGRIKGAVYALIWLVQPEKYEFTDGIARATLNVADHSLITLEFADQLTAPHRIDLGIYHTLRHLLHGVLDRSYINQINAGESMAGAV